MSARDYIVQALFVALAAGGIVGVRALVVRKPKKRPAQKTDKARKAKPRAKATG